MIYVVGDSWSSADINDERYPLVQSLPARLERAGFDVQVVAEPGNNMLDQLHKLSLLNPSASDTIVFGWTDLFRNWGQNQDSPTGILPGFEAAQDYGEALTASAQEVWNTAGDIAPGSRWLHWGGQAQVVPTSTGYLPQGHTVIYRDYPSQQYGAPGRTPHLSTWTTGQCNSGRINEHLLASFTLGDDYYSAVDQQARINTHCVRNTELFPDGGHLSWNHYTELEQKICYTIRNS